MQNGSEHCNSAAGVLLKAGSKVGVTLALLVVGQNALHDAGNPNGVVPTGLSAVHALHGTADTGLVELFKLLSRPLNAHLAALCDFLGGARSVELHVHHYLAHIVIDDGSEDAILGIFVGDARVGQTFEADLGSQLQNIRSVCHM